MPSRTAQIPAAPEALDGSSRKRRGPRPKPVVDYPAPSGAWADPSDFHDALIFHMERHGDTIWHLHKALSCSGEQFDRTTLREWCAGRKSPRSARSFTMLERIERRYSLEAGYFRGKLPHPARATMRQAMSTDLSPSERRRLAWHLPDDFDERPESERAEILDWVRRVIISGSTDYRRFQAEALRERFSLRFPAITGRRRSRDGVPDGRDAPRSLEREVLALVRFKTATLTDVGFERLGIWKDVTAHQKVEHLGLLFGALAASPGGVTKGAGIPLGKLAIGLLVFPAVWDWYIRWREQRRGFYTSWEVNMLRFGMALARRETGWLRQCPELGKRVKPLRGLITRSELNEAKSDWSVACDRLYAFAKSRAKEVDRVSRVHRDPFEPILPILEASSPLAEYRRITEEILKLMPDKRRHPRAAAEAVRAFLMLRLGLHLGLRQKNLRELLVCRRGDAATSERELKTRQVGELRWSQREEAWEVFVPASAFKNSTSSFFGGCSFRLALPNFRGLTEHVSAYIEEHRSILLASAPDPGTFFVKSAKATTRDASYNQTTFYDAWRLVIQRYGIFNPYTGRGAIAGLLPHGPHNVRDVLATHILKQTGSYEQASYAIQDTPAMVAKHYGRFLPQDKAALAAKILNLVWAESSPRKVSD